MLSPETSKILITTPMDPAIDIFLCGICEYIV